MRAIVQRGFGSPEALAVEEIGRPVPDAGEVLVAVRAASLNPLDWHMLRGTPRIIRLSAGFGRNRVLRVGRDVAGVVEAVGADVARLRPGDAVFGACQGAFADWVCGAESAFAVKPEALSFEAAAAIPVAGLTALQGLRDRGRLRKGQRVLINGAAGGVGTFAVQIAKLLEADVTAVCSGASAELMRGLGADRVIDYEKEDFAGAGGGYDLVFDMVGNRTFRTLRRLLSPGGRVVAVGGGGPEGRGIGRWLSRAIGATLAFRFTGRRVSFFVSRLDLDDLEWLAERIVEGAISPVIERRYPLERAAEAMRRVASGHARGKILLVPEAGSPQRT